MANCSFFYWLKKVLYLMIILIGINITMIIFIYVYIIYDVNKHYYADIYAEENKKLQEIDIVDGLFQFSPWDELPADQQYENT